MKKTVLMFLSAFLLLCSCTSQTDSDSNAQSSNASEADISHTSSTVSDDDSSVSKPDAYESSNITSDDNSSVSEPNDEESSNIFITYIDNECYLPAEYEEFVENLLSSDGWNDEIAECICNFTIQIGEEVFEYSSDCGTFNSNGKSKQLSSSDQTEFNNILTELFESFKENQSVEPEPEFVRGPGNPMQPTHQTPDDLNCYSDSTRYWGTEITPIYIQMVDLDRLFVRVDDSAMISSSHDDDGYIEQAGLKLWICTESGKKIDYVYTNSDGIAKFECTEGVYNIYFEGDDTWAAKYCGTIHADGKYTDYLLGGSYYRKYTLLTYHDVYEDFKVRVIDTETKKPVKGAKVKVSDTVLYTDSDGYAVFKPLLYYVTDIGTVFSVHCESDGYVGNYSNDATLYKTYLEIEMEAIKLYDFSITVLEYDTKTPLSGVVVSHMPTSGKEETVLYNTVTGEDGIIRGRVSSEEFDNYLFVYIKYTKEYTLQDGTTIEYTAEYTVKINADNLDRTVYVEYAVRDHKFRDG